MADVPPEEGAESTLERVRQRLYANAEQRQAAPGRMPVTHASAESWKPEAPNKRGLSATAWFFILALGFFLIAGIAAALILFLGGRSVGNDRVSLSFEGPISVDGGEAVSLDVILENGNPVEAQNLMLSIDFPEGAFVPDTMEPLGHYAIPLENLLPGAVIRHSVKVTYFGAENQKLSIPVTVEYRTPNSSAVFVKEEVRETTITTAPLSIRISATPETSSGQRITISASVRSNAPEILQNVALKAEYPFGFSYISSEPGLVGSNVFPLGDLAPGEEKKVTITGTLVGEDGDERVFRFLGGVLPGPEATALRTPAYTLADAGVKLTKSFLAVSLSLNQEQGDIVAHAGESLQATLSWVNALTTSVADGEIRVALTGDAFSPSSIDVVNGFYRSGDRVVIFDESTEPGLRSLGPGESGAGAFRFSIKEENELRALRSPSATLTVSVSGRRIGEGGREENLTSTLIRNVKIATDLSLESSVVYSTGPFENRGPWPPEADKETTYTVRWKVGNTINTVANARVTAILPTNVRYTGAASPASAISFNEVTREVTWALEEVAAGTIRDGAFQIAVTPSISEIGTTPVILSGQAVSGFDRFVQVNVGEEAQDLTTRLPEDPDFQSADGRVK